MDAGSLGLAIALVLALVAVYILWLELHRPRR
jgi:hypothetical protein